MSPNEHLYNCIAMAVRRLRYIGQYTDDLPHGYGVYYFGSGQKYEGEWAHGKKHGWSIYTVGGTSPAVQQGGWCQLL